MSRTNGRPGRWEAAHRAAEIFRGDHHTPPWIADEIGNAMKDMESGVPFEAVCDRWPVAQCGPMRALLVYEIAVSVALAGRFST